MNRFKKFLCNLIVVSIFFSFCQTAIMAANEEISVGSETQKSVGLADETELLKEKGLLNTGNYSEEIPENEFLPEEKMDSYVLNLGEISEKEEEVGDKENNYKELFVEHVKKNEISNTETKKIVVMGLDMATPYAISYYSGSKIPTYTYVTDRSLYDTYRHDDGTISYMYYYNQDEYFEYVEYLMDYCGWQYFDDEVTDTSGMIFLVKGEDMIAIVADFMYGRTIVMIPPSSTIEATSISLNTSSRTMIVGNMYTLNATISPSDTTDKEVTWSSSNSDVASVSEDGVVIAKKAGSATITAKTSNGKKATCAITVKSLILDYYPNSQIPTFTCITGKQIYTTQEDDGLMMYFYNLDWESHTDYEAYLVHQDGWTIIEEKTADDYSYFLAWYKKGETELCVLANFANNMTGIAFEEKSEVSVTDVNLNKTAGEMTVGDTMTLTATVVPSNASNKNVTWSSSNTKVATVSSSGVVTAKATGTAVITVKTTDGNKIATCTVTVKAEEIPVTGVLLNKSETTLFVGESETLLATVTPEEATNKDVIWSSSDTKVATVSSKGVVTANAIGTAIITVNTVDEGKSTTCIVTVEPRTPLLEVENVYGQKGKMVDVTVNLVNNPGIAILGFDVDYNKEVMILKSAELGEIFTGELECNLESVPFVFNVYSGSVNKTNEGALVTLQFEIKEDCPVGEYEIILSNIEGLNIDELVVDFVYKNGMITIRDSIPGDVIGDGSVTRSDLLRLAKHFSGFTVEIDEVAADVTGDGKVTRNDLLRLAKHFSGFDVELGN